MSNEQIIEVFFDMRRELKLTHKQQEALAWAAAKLMKTVPRKQRKSDG